MRLPVLQLLLIAMAPAADSAVIRSLNDTGQTNCFDAGVLTACTAQNSGDASPHPGQDGRFGRDALAAAGLLTKTGSGVAGFDFTRICSSGEPAGDGSCPASPVPGVAPDQWGCTLDNTTGLLWETKTPSSNDLTYTYDEAMTTYVDAVNASTLCGFNDWRLPTRRELWSIVNLARTSPAIDFDFFPSFPPNVAFWTSDLYAPFTGSAWTVSFANGGNGISTRGTLRAVRLVRGAPASRLDLVLNLDGTVTDPSTGLMWDRCSWGQALSQAGGPGETCTGAATELTWQSALSAASTARAENHRGYTDWRLPNISELETLQDVALVEAPLLDQAAFPATPSASFWSSTVFANPTNAISAFLADFVIGGVQLGLQSSTRPVRLVRGGLSSDGYALLTTVAGDGQTGAAGSDTQVPPSVVVRDANGTPLAKVAVTFAVARGGGSVMPTGPVLTDASGVARAVAWTLGTSAGTNLLTATAAGVPEPVTFTASGIAGAAAQLSVLGGNDQTATAGTAVAVPPSVILGDANGNPVAGVAVSFVVSQGGGGIEPSGPILTGSDGVASTSSWTLGTSAGPNSLIVTAAGLESSPVVFSAAGTAGPASDIAVAAGDGQSALLGTAVAIAPSVLVRDLNGNPVAGAAVTFAVATGGGTVLPASPVLTGQDGVAAASSWTLGASAGANTLTAVASGLNDRSATFIALALPESVFADGFEQQ